jgi:hypothetical protein
MKLTPQQIERIALWAIVLLLIIVVVLFGQRRSGFTPTAGAPISLMDLQEYSVLPEKQKMNYKTELLNKMSTLTSIMTNDTMPDVKQRMYSDELGTIMRAAMVTQPPVQTMTPQQPQESQQPPASQPPVPPASQQPMMPPTPPAPQPPMM